MRRLLLCMSILASTCSLSSLAVALDVGGTVGGAAGRAGGSWRCGRRSGWRGRGRCRQCGGRDRWSGWCRRDRRCGGERRRSGGRRCSRCRHGRGRRCRYGWRRDRLEHGHGWSCGWNRQRSSRQRARQPADIGRRLSWGLRSAFSCRPLAGCAIAGTGQNGSPGLQPLAQLDPRPAPARQHAALLPDREPLSAQAVADSRAPGQA